MIRRLSVILKPSFLLGFWMLLFSVGMNAQDYEVNPLISAPQLSLCKSSPDGGGPIVLDVALFVDNGGNANDVEYDWFLDPIPGETVPGSTPPVITALAFGAPYPSGTVASGNAFNLLAIEIDPTNAVGGPWELRCVFEDNSGTPQITITYRLVLDFFPEFTDIFASPDRLQDDKGVICDGGSVELDIFISNANQLATAPSYLWTGPSGATFNPANNSREVFVDQVGTYNVQLRNGCGVTTKSIEVVSGSDPIITTDPVNFVACTGAAANFSVDVAATGLAPDPYVEFDWVGDGFIVGSGSTVNNPDGSKTNTYTRNPVLAGDNETFYSVIVNNDGCIASSGSAELRTIPLNPEFVNPSLIEGGERFPNGSISFEKVVKSAAGDNTIIQWALTDALGTTVLQKNTAPMGDPPVLEDILSSDAMVSGTLTDVDGEGLTIDWTITNTPDSDLSGVYTTNLMLTNAEENLILEEAIADFTVMLTAINVDDEGNSCGPGVMSNTANVTFLPVELLYFQGEPAEEGILLSWATATEIDNDIFTVERSADGVTFDPIAVLAGAGTVFEEQYYEYQDREVNAGLVYYRLKQTDFDGQFSYSDIISVDLTAEAGKLELIRTVSANGLLEYQFKTGISSDLTVSLIDINGRIISQRRLNPTIGVNEDYLDIAQLPQGIYILQLHDGKDRISKRILR